MQGACAGLTTFPDVKRESWYHAFVQNMQYQDIIHGYEDGLYRPAKTIKKAELFKIAAISFGYLTKEQADEVRSRRNTQMQWYIPYINALEITEVVPSWIQDMSPDEEMTRGDVFALLSNILRDIDGQ